MSQAPPTAAEHSANLEIRIARTGAELVETLSKVLEAVPDRPQGPQALARRIHIDKVLASRVLRAVGAPDAMSALHRIPGPEPLRKLLRAAAAQGVHDELIRPAEDAVDRFAGLIRDDFGDRGALDAIVSAWAPEARREFELRRKQTAFKAMSQLKGAQANAILATAIIAPSNETGRLDLVWLSGLFGLQRLRPAASVKLATRRMNANGGSRRPFTLAGDEVEHMQEALLTEFSSAPPPHINVRRVGEVVHYSLAEGGFGPNTAQDFVIAEVNRGELPRYTSDDPGKSRDAFVFADVSPAAKILQFDAIIHDEIYPGSEPRLKIYDTSFEGAANVNDPARDIDQIDLLESVEFLGRGVERLGSSTIPRYGQIVRHVCDALRWTQSSFRVYRCTIEYPVYGSQVAMCFDMPRAR